MVAAFEEQARRNKEQICHLQAMVEGYQEALNVWERHIVETITEFEKGGVVARIEEGGRSSRRG